MYDGSWMTVCDVNWYLHEARVLCKMLGFDGALDAPLSARFGQGSGYILYVSCQGTEDGLEYCYTELATSYCRHDRDAGAVCYSGGRNFIRDNRKYTSFKIVYETFQFISSHIRKCRKRLNRSFIKCFTNQMEM